MARGWTFRLPRDSADDFRAHVADGVLVGKDSLPWPTEIVADMDSLVVRRDLHESTSLQLPLPIPDFGRVVVQTCPLPEGGDYWLPLELARGEVDKARNEVAECERRGLRPSLALRQTLDHACACLTSAIFSKRADRAMEALRAALWCGELVVEEFGRLAAGARKGRTDKPLRLSCVFDDRFFDVENPGALRKLFDAVTIPVDWRSLELDTGERQWEALERRVDWCLDRGLAVTVGPILDLHALPGWLTGLEGDAAPMLMIDLVETAVSRLHDRVTSWEVVSGANSSKHFDGDDRSLMLLVMKTLEAVRSQDPQARLSATVDRPWGDYLTTGDRRTGPLDFLDRLIRVDAPITSLNLEIAVGVEGGSKRRSAVDFRRLLHQYAELGPSLAVRLFHPAADDDEDASYAGQSGEDRQADWLETHLLAAIAEPSVDRIEWGRLHDLPGQRRPGCGLFDENREPRRALRRLRAVRKACF
jgi:hypothetical protein